MESLIKTLLREAQASEDKEAYKALEKTPNYRIGIGARVNAPDPPIFFIEILIQLSPTQIKTEPDVFEKSLACLKELQKKKYAVTCQDSQYIACETSLPAKSIDKEYNKIKSLMKTYLPCFN
jgi:hypothetical protein